MCCYLVVNLISLISGGRGRSEEWGGGYTLHAVYPQCLTPIGEKITCVCYTRVVWM